MEESVDYYFNEQGLMVFTAAYHLKRGYCCKNKCMHCPWNYGKENLQNASKITIKPNDKNDATEEGNENCEI